MKLILIMAVLLAFSHLFGYLFHRFAFPKVMGEVFGGFLLGPTVMGMVFPGIYHGVLLEFDRYPEVVSLLSWVGLSLLMLISGFEVRKSFDRSDKKIISAAFLGSTVIPFTAGWIFPLVFGITPIMGVNNNALALTVVIGIASSVTAIPVLARIFMDLKVLNSRFARIVLTTATLHDIILWIALAVAGSLVGRSSGGSFAMACPVLMFLFGIVLDIFHGPRIEKGKALVIKPALILFIPLYFALVGVKVDLIRHFDPGLFCGFLFLTTALAAGGTLLAARIAGLDWFSGFNLSVAMNTRGAVGIILATAALDLGIINQTFFAILVLTAMLTSLSAGYWFKYVLSRGWTLIKA